MEDMKKVLGDKLFGGWLQQNKLTDQTVTLAKGEGCSECNNTGYSGRIAIFEVLPVSEKIGKLILERAPALVIEKQAISDGMLLSIPKSQQWTVFKVRKVIL